MIGDRAPYTSWQIKTLFLQEMFARGILTIGTHNLCYAHGDADIDRLLSVYAEVLPLLADSVRAGRLLDDLRCAPLEPLFRVR
jgi:glutamate-1-semialdehyde 2,1-aminomutase